MKFFEAFDTLVRKFILWYATCWVEWIRSWGHLPQVLMAKVPKLAVATLALGVYMCTSLHINPLQPQAQDFDKAACWTILPFTEAQYQTENFIRKSEGKALAPGMTIPKVCQPFLAANKGTSIKTNSGVRINVSPNTLLLD